MRQARQPGTGQLHFISQFPCTVPALGGREEPLNAQWFLEQLLQCEAWIERVRRILKDHLHRTAEGPH